MKILLTGASGFIGRNFLLYRPSDWRVFALDRVEDKNFQKKIPNARFFKINLTDGSPRFGEAGRQVRYLAQKLNLDFDVCLHLAANGDPALSVSAPLWDIQSTTETLINIGMNFKIDKLIYLSSGAVYNGHRGLISPKIKIEPILPYAISHFAAEQYVRFYQRAGKIKQYVIIRFFGAYGPYEPPRKIYTNLVKALGMKKYYSSSEAQRSREVVDNSSRLRSNYNHREFTIRGNGKNLIDAMFVEDAIRGLVAVIKSSKTNITIDFCKGEHPNINQLVREAAKIFNLDIKIKHQGQVPEYNQFYASPAQFQRFFGFRAKTTLEEGLEKLEGWIRRNKE